MNTAIFGRFIPPPRRSNDSPIHGPDAAGPFFSMRCPCAPAAAAALLLLLPSLLARAATLIVPTDHPTIQAAIDNAAIGDSILIEPGTYTENVVLRSGVDVAGRETARTIIQPQDEVVATVNIGSVTNARLSNLTIIDSSTSVQVIFSSGVTLANMVFDNAAIAAIAVDQNSIVDVVNNVFFGNDVGVQRGSGAVGIVNSIFRNNRITVASSFGAVNNNLNVDANCWFNNADLLIGGADGSYGTNAVIGDPLFVDPAARDFHLAQGSACIDIGLGTDVIDGTRADAGAYGGDIADAVPFPVAGLALTDASNATFDIDVSWARNEAYLVTNTVSPGSYRIYYRQNDAGPPYTGTDVDGGQLPSPIDAGDSDSLLLNNLTPSAPAVTAPTVLSAEGVNAAVVLTWEPVAAASGYRIRYGASSTTENTIDAGTQTSFMVDGLTNGTTYRFSVSALSQASYHVAVTAVDNTVTENESEFSDEASLAIGPVAEGPPSAEVTALPQVILPYPLLPDEGGCFIATAAFGADWTREVRLLRRFRDEYLLTNRPGRWLVALYYRVSPPLADELRDRPTARAIVRALLMPAVALAWVLLETTGAAKLMSTLLVFGLGGLIVIHRRTAAPRAEAEG